MDSSPTTIRPRLTSLDQFRGYTMLGMLLVNFLGGYAVCPRILKHTHDYCSYADTIMPHFLFAAGFAMRLSLTRRMEAAHGMPWGRVIRRILGLALVAIVWYSFCDLHGLIERLRSQDFGSVLYGLAKRTWFQTLMHIAVTSLWILPVVTASPRVRIAFAAGSGLLHVVLSWWFNFAWVHASPTGIDGGPLGVLTWAVPAICGTLAYDMVKLDGVAAAPRIARAGLILAGLAWMMSCGTTIYDIHVEPSESAAPADAMQPEPPAEKLASDPVVPSVERWRMARLTLTEPPFVPPPDYAHRQWNYWMMSQRSGNLSYPTFAAGLSLLLYAGFLWACDGRGWTLGIFRTLGTNSLAAYILHDIAGWTVAPWFPEQSPSVLLTMAGFVCFTASVYVACRLLERRGWYLRV